MSTPRRSHSPQVIDLTFLTEEEEVKLRAVLEEDLKLQQDEENRLKSLRDSITEDSTKYATTRPGTQCARCGTRFGWIFNTGALCPTCSERVCKQDRIYDSYAHTWMCTLCNKRMQLHTSEEVLSRSYGPSHILRLSFRERKRYQQQQEVDKVQSRYQPPVHPPPLHHDQHRQQNKSPVTMETAPRVTSTKGAVPVTMQPSVRVEQAVPRSSPVISRKSPSSDIPRSSPVVTRRNPTTVDSQAKILGITEPLPQPNIVIETSEETEKQQHQHHNQHQQDHQQHRHQQQQHLHQQESVTKDTASTLVAPYPPGVMVKSNPAITIQGNIYIKVYSKGNKRLVVKADKATGLAAADSGKTSNPYALAYVLPDHRRLSKKKSKVELRTIDPVWDTYWEFAMESNDYTGKVLWISIWDWKRFTKSEFLGEVMLPLWTLDLTDKSTRSYPLEPEHSVPQSAGDLKLSLRYEPPEADDDSARKKKKVQEGRLRVRIQEARGLFYDNSFVKCFLRPGKLRAHAHQDSHIITQPKCPVYDEDFVFEKVTVETLSTEHVLEITVWDALFVAQPMGVIRLGPHPNGSKPWMDSHGAEVSHWEAMLEKPNEWLEQWHVLRPDADFRKVSENKLPSPDIAALTDSYEPLRNSSPENSSDTEPQPRQRSSSLGNKPAPKSVLVYPGTDAVTDKPTDIGNSATFPRRVENKDPLILDDHELKALTKENTKLNRESICSLTDTGVKKQVSLLLTEEVKDTTSSEGHHLTTSGSFTTPLTVQSDMSDMQSVYSGSAMYTDNEVTGEIQLGLSYSENEQALNVSINKARGLTAPKDNENSANPYVKIYLLPDRSKTTKKKTSVKKGVDPIFNEVIKYPVRRQHLSQHKLLVGVWHNDFWRHNQFLGEVILPLDKVDLSNPSDKWYSLEESSHENTRSSMRGQLKISLQFNITDNNKQKGNLEVTVVSAHNLLQIERTCNPIVKCHLLPDYKKKFKTKVCKDTTDPVWNDKFVFEKLKLEDLRSNRVVELTVWDLSKNKQYDFIGGLRLGPRPHHDNILPYMDSSDTELTHWMSVMDTPGHSVEQLHTLRHNMDPRTVTIATSEPSKEVTNETSATDRVPSYDVTMTSQVMGSHDPVPGYDVTTTSQEVMGSHDPVPQYESMPVTRTAMITQPSITISTEGSPPPDVKLSHHGNEHSPLRKEKLKFDDDDDDDHSSTPSHQSPHQSRQAKLPVSPSMDSISSGISIYSQAGGGKGHYDITGSLLLAVYHTNNRLVINVKEAHDIVGVNSNKLSNSYVKLYLLPDPNKETKKKTRTIRKSVNPVFNEEFSYDGSLNHMQGRTLQVSVWNRDRFGHNKFLGEVRLQLGDMLLSDTAHHSYTLQEMDDDDVPAYVGDIRVMLQFVADQDKKGKKKGRGTLLVWIQQARQLPIVRSGATFVQCTLLPRGKSERFKSEIVQGNSDPTYNVKFKFEKVTDVELSYDRALEITIWEPYRSTNEFIGGIRLGPKPQPSTTGANKEWMDSIGSEVSQWELMTARPEQWADEWHALRSSMKPRDILF